MAQGRAAAMAELMTLTLVAYSPDGTAKDADGYDVVGYVDRGQTVGYVPRKSRAGSDAATRYLNIGGTERPVLMGGLSIPIDAPLPSAGEQVGNGWEYEVAVIGPEDDPALLGRRFLVVAVPVVSTTARRLDVVEVN